jgi:hypothetical protein
MEHDLMVHSRHVVRLRAALASAAVVLVAAACGSSTSPKAQTPAQLAAYWDAYAGTHLTAGTGRDTILAEVAEILNGPIAYGQLPTKVTLHAGDSSQTWSAIGVMLVDSAASDSEAVVIAWQDSVLTTFALLAATGSTLPHLQIAQFGIAADANNLQSADSSSVTLAVAARSGACASTAIAHVYPLIPTYEPVNHTCTLASITAGGHLHFPTAVPALQDVDVTSTTIAAVRLQRKSGAGFERVHGLRGAISLR